MKYLLSFLAAVFALVLPLSALAALTTVPWRYDTTANTYYTYPNITGKVGIGTTSPWGQLSVNPNALGSGIPEFIIGSSTTTHLVVTGNGNVGIGTANPTQGFDFFGKVTLRSSDGALTSTAKASFGAITITNQADTIQETGSARQLYLMGGSAGAAAAGAEIDLIGPTNTTNPGTIAFRTGTTGANQANPIAGFVTANGSWGIGTTTPSSQFTVATSTATTTIEVGDQYSSNSHACFNTKNTAGANVSFYIVGTAFVVESNRCR